MTGFFLIAAILTASPTSSTPPKVAPDTLRQQVASLSAKGDLDSALALVEKAAPALPASWAGLYRGKLVLRGADAHKSFDSAIADSLHGDASRGEAVFRLGQWHYAAGEYRLAIPRFREYLLHYPRGPWRNPAAYWMGYSCLQLVRQYPAKKVYLDTGLHYVEGLESRGRPKGYYLPLALAIKARLMIARGNNGDTAAALKALDEARRRAPDEEVPANLLLSAQAAKRVNPDTAMLWEDSVMWEYPTSMEASLLVTPAASSVASTQGATTSTTSTTPAPSPSTSSAKSAVSKTKAPSRYTLQLGSFTLGRNAEEMRKKLAAKKIRVWIEQNAQGASRAYRVFHGIFADSLSARKEGLRLFKPMSYPFRVVPLSP